MLLGRERSFVENLTMFFGVGNSSYVNAGVRFRLISCTVPF